MKKVVLSVFLIAVIAAVTAGFTACSTATTQGQLENVWQNYEKYTYTVTRASGETGEYSVVIKGYKKGSTIENFGDATLSDVREGYLVTGELRFGDIQYLTKCYFELINGSNYLLPKATYRKQTVGGAEKLKLQGNYSGNTLSYDLIRDGQTSNGSLKLTSPYFDNNEFHQALRGISTFSTGFSFGFQVPIISSEISAASLTLSCSKKETVATNYTPVGAETPLSAEAYACSLSRSTKVDGMAHTLYYAVDDIKVNGWPLKRVLVKFIEPSNQGDVTYTLSDISIIEN